MNRIKKQRGGKRLARRAIINCVNLAIACVKLAMLRAQLFAIVNYKYPIGGQVFGSDDEIILPMQNYSIPINDEQITRSKIEINAIDTDLQNLIEKLNNHKPEKMEW